MQHGVQNCHREEHGDVAISWRTDVNTRSQRDCFVTVFLAMTTLGFTGSYAHADTLDTRGMAPHEQCAYCHGLDGNSAMPRFPRLAGQSASYLRKQLADFKRGRRTNDEGAMSGIAESLSEADVENIVRHYAGQALRVRASDVEGDAAAGRRLYFNGRRAIAACATCHGTVAPVLEGAPRLLGQHGAYLAKQLQDFRRGARRNDADGVMHRIAQALAESEIRALAAFLSAQPVMTGANR